MHSMINTTNGMAKKDISSKYFCLLLDKMIAMSVNVAWDVIEYDQISLHL